MAEIIHIGNADLNIKEWNGQRVVTFKDIDAVHGRPDGTARKRFIDNRERFIEGEDFFVLTPQSIENAELSEKRTFENSGVSQRGTTYVTEQGYLMLVKSFTDDLAWKVQRELVNSYFRVRSLADEDLSPNMKILMNMVNQMAMNELEQKRMKAQVDRLEQTTQAIKDAVKPISDNWRDEINKKFNRIQSKCDRPFQYLRIEMYTELEHRAGVDLGTRLRNLRMRMEDNGYTKTAISGTNKMDVIEQDKKLREIFGKIVTEYEMRYCA